MCHYCSRSFFVKFPSYWSFLPPCAFLPGPLSQTRGPCSSLPPQQPMAIGVPLLHSGPHTETRRFPAAPVPLHTTPHCVRRDLKPRRTLTQASCGVCSGLMPPVLKVDRGAEGEAGSSAWGRKDRLQQMILEVEGRNPKSDVFWSCIIKEFWNVRKQIHKETYFQHEQRHKKALWDSCHTAAYHYTSWIYKSVNKIQCDIM